ncbi:MAG TPA: hypothetical protein DCR87_08645 [Acidobacteria bacterium]|nr:hypothetical protein [Acidobacteriota bacterium]
MNGLLKNQKGMNIVGQGGKIIFFTLPSLLAARYLHRRFPDWEDRVWPQYLVALELFKSGLVVVSSDVLG